LKNSEKRKKKGKNKNNKRLYERDLRGITTKKKIEFRLLD
jgi:hypothetical protein